MEVNGNEKVACRRFKQEHSCSIDCECKHTEGVILVVDFRSVSCHKLSFSSKNKQTYDALREAIFNVLIRIEEQHDGHSFHFSYDCSLLHRIAEWIPLELTCCPFLKANVSIDKKEGITLTLSGPLEVKSFLLQELQLA